MGITSYLSLKRNKQTVMKSGGVCFQKNNYIVKSQMYYSAERSAEYKGRKMVEPSHSLWDTEESIREAERSHFKTSEKITR